MNEDNERWLSDGDCSKCRRKNYCQTACTRSKRALESFIRNAIRQKTGIDTMEAAMDGRNYQ